MLRTIEKEYYISNIQEFIYYFDLENWFIENYNVSIEDWDYKIEDEIIIKRALQEFEGEYFLIFNPENTGSFSIYKLL